MAGAFKTVTTRLVNQTIHSTEAVWQRNYYEHIIKDDIAFKRILEYIQANPSRWERDADNVVEDAFNRKE